MHATVSMITGAMVWSYLFPTLLIIGIYVWLQRQKEQRTLLFQKEKSPDRAEPATLHPLIDPLKCMGCRACVLACPEQNVLEVIQGRAQLISPSHCIGHGACQSACPTHAITLVFGSKVRGVDIPRINSHFETNIPGIFIAGELGGMGLIRNAIEQGRQAMQSIGQSIRKKEGRDGVYDVLIVGSGPAGFSASLEAIAEKLNYVTIEQNTLGGAVLQYPRGKIVMSSPAQLPLHGPVHFREISKENLLNFWQDVKKKTGVHIQFNERVESIHKEEAGFRIQTAKQVYRAHHVLLAMGRRGTPRKLNVPGEELSKVVYQLTDPQQYEGQHVLVVGGGDSALEAAIALAEIPTTTVTLSYRGESFSRAKPKNLDKIAFLHQSHRLILAMNSQVLEIKPSEVVIKEVDRIYVAKNDAVLICAGGILPTQFLKDIGIEVDMKYGSA